MQINKLKWLLAIACLPFFYSQSFAQSNACVVSGKISGLEKDSRIIVKHNGGEHGANDTLKLATIKANGDFSFELPASVCNELYELRIEGVRSSLMFVAEKGNVKINGDKNKLYTAELKGTPENDRWNNYQKFIIAQVMKGNELMMNRDKYTKEERVALFKKIDADKKSYADSLIKNHPNSIV